jgi:hypothetical protein
MARHALLRASDADREQVAERLRHATAEGRLLAHELEERLDAVFSARTYGELDAVVADLPGPGHGRRERSTELVWLRRAIALAIAIPLAFAVIAAALFVLTGVLAVWMVWIALGWWLFGHRRRTCAARRHHPYTVSRRAYDFRRL